MAKATNEIFIGKKPLMTYVTAALVQLANEPSVTIKARGMSITKAVDVSQIIVKRMDTLGYKITTVKIGSEQLQSQDGKTRNVSTIEIEVAKEK
jgi:DNA-binding protein